MGEVKAQNLQERWKMIKKYGSNCRIIDTASSSSSSLASSMINDDSTVSNGSSSYSNDDASSRRACFSSSYSVGALYDLTELMSQLPIKRALSEYYQGKSESFTCLSMVTSIEELAKKNVPYRRKSKGSKSCEGGLGDAHKSFTLPKSSIFKKTSRSLSLINSRPPQVPSRKKA